MKLSNCVIRIVLILYSPWVPMSSTSQCSLYLFRLRSFISSLARNVEGRTVRNSIDKSFCFSSGNAAAP